MTFSYSPPHFYVVVFSFLGSDGGNELHRPDIFIVLIILFYLIHYIFSYSLNMGCKTNDSLRKKKHQK